MVKLTLEVKKQPAPLSSRFIKIQEKTLNYTSSFLLGELKKFSPVDHGRLQGSWSIFDKTKESHTIKSSAHYADYVNRGTGLYGPFKQKIYPKNSNHLSFVYDGKKIAVPWVKGMKPRKFVEKSIENTDKRVDGFLIKAAIEVDKGGN